MRMRVCLLLFAVACGLFTVGCSESKAPVATSGDEVSRYLDEHPELKEKQVDPGLSDPTK